MKPSILQTIVVPLDGSALAECAVPVALTLLPAEGGRLILMRVPVYAETQAPMGAEYNMFWPEIRDTPGTFRQVYEDTLAYLSHVADRFRRDGLTVDIQVEEGDRAGAIIDVARVEKADLIVMTTHGRTGVSRWVIGSITERVLHEAPCPVLAVRAEPACTPEQPTPAFAQRILVPLDGSELAEPALPPALSVAKQTGGSLVLLRVAGSAAEASTGNGPSPSTGEQDYLERMAGACREQGVEATAIVVPQNGSGATSVANAILEFAVGETIDLIAMSTHGRSGLRRWVYGSVTEKVLHNSEIALLIIRP